MAVAATVTFEVPDYDLAATLTSGQALAGAKWMAMKTRGKMSSLAVGFDSNPTAKPSPHALPDLSATGNGCVITCSSILICKPFMTDSPPMIRISSLRAGRVMVYAF